MLSLTRTGLPARPRIGQVAATGPWYQTIWSEPAIVGVPVVPTLLGVVALIALVSMLSAG